MIIRCFFLLICFYSVSAQDLISSFVEKQQWSLLSDSAKVSTAYSWITNNIAYDVERASHKPTINYKYEDIALRTFRSKKAVCMGYAALLKEFLTTLNIPSVVVEGHCKDRNQKEIYNHAWVAFQLKGNWFLADPTWDAGYVDGSIFHSKPGRKFFKALPNEFILRHFPHDPIFQLKEDPINYTEFVNGKIKGSRQLPYRMLLKDHNFEKRINYERAFRFQPENPFIAHQLAVNYMDSAQLIIAPCIEDYNRNAFDNQRAKQCQVDVENGIVKLKKAQELLQKVWKTSDEHKDMAALNLRVINKNLLSAQLLKKQLEK